MKDTPFRRLLHNAYEDGIYTPRGGFAEFVRSCWENDNDYEILWMAHCFVLDTMR